MHVAFFTTVQHFWSVLRLGALYHACTCFSQFRCWVAILAVTLEEIGPLVCQGNVVIKTCKGVLQIITKNTILLSQI
jgi:hypothetical protein